MRDVHKVCASHASYPCRCQLCCCACLLCLPFNIARCLTWPCALALCSLRALQLLTWRIPFENLNTYQVGRGHSTASTSYQLAVR
jgi:hypothetical protein